MRNNALFALWRPHLVIYLDVPVDETRRRIEARNCPNEKDSLVTTPAYLQALVDSYKKDYLKDIRYYYFLLNESPEGTYLTIRLLIFEIVPMPKFWFTTGRKWQILKSSSRTLNV